LELGRFLVREYLGERSNETLSRWLLHAIAERISSVDHAKKRADRLRLENEAADLILRFWTHRAVGPKGVNPLAKYDRVLEAFRSLLPGANPWESREAERSDRFAAALYESMAMLTLSLLLVGLESPEKRSAEERALHNRFLPTNEAAILLHFEQIENFFSLSERSAKTAVHKNEREAGSVDVAGAVQSWAQRTAELSRQVLELFKLPSPSSELPGVREDAGKTSKTAIKKVVGHKPKGEKNRTTAKKTSKKRAQKKLGKENVRTMRKT
jgi:hypothetical protein